MYNNKLINQIDLRYKEKSLIVKKRYESKFDDANYFKEEVRKELYALYGSDVLYNEGLVVKTSIDTSLQYLADKALMRGLINYDKKKGWRGPLDKINFNKSKFNKILKNIKNPFPNKWLICMVESRIENIVKIYCSKKNHKIIDLNLNENIWLKDDKFEKGDIIFSETINNVNLIRQLPEVNGAIIVIDPHTGKILALSGGFSFKLSEFNRATQAKRQPGSAFKPFVYISALKEGYTPSTLVLDAPYVVDQGPGLPKWKPSNYTEKFYGLNSMRTGIEKSRNLMTIRLSDKIGMDKILKTAKDFKIEKYMDSNLSMSLGSGLVTLKNLTNAYAMIVNGGKSIEPTLIMSVYSKEGKQILNNNNKKCLSCNQINSDLDYNLPKLETKNITVLDERIAYQITSMLEGVVKRGTGRENFIT